MISIIFLFCNFKIINLDKVFFESYKSGNKLSKDVALEILSKHPTFTKYYLGISLKDSLALGHVIKHLSNSYQVKVFQESTIKFKDISDTEVQLDLALKKIQKYFTNYKIPDIYIFSCGLSSDIYCDKNIIVIDLSYFFGKNSKCLPSMPEYMISRYSKRSIIPRIVNMIAIHLSRYNPNDQSLVADMVYHGRIYFFTKHILKSYSYEEIIGYAKKDIGYIKKNKSFIWNYLIKKQLLYNKIKGIKAIFIDEAPYTLDFGTNSPGKIGRWFGIEIMESFYKKNKDKFSIVGEGGFPIFITNEQISKCLQKNVIINDLFHKFKYFWYISRWLTCFNPKIVDLKKIMNINNMRFIFINSGYTRHV